MKNLSHILLLLGLYAPMASADTGNHYTFAPTHVLGTVLPANSYLSVPRTVTLSAGQTSTPLSAVVSNELASLYASCTLEHDSVLFDRQLAPNNFLRVVSTSVACSLGEGSRCVDSVRYQVQDQSDAHITAVTCSFHEAPTFKGAFDFELVKKYCVDADGTDGLDPELASRILASCGDFKANYEAGQIGPSKMCVPTTDEIACTLNAWIFLPEGINNPQLGCSIDDIERQFSDCRFW